MFAISNETTADHSSIDTLLDQGFGPNRHRLTVNRLRLGAPRADLGFVVRRQGHVVASLRFWPVLIGGTTPALLLGPLVVSPGQQGAGIGKRLVEFGLNQVTRKGWRLCLVVGSPKYYAPFGFEPAAPLGLSLPGPVDQARFQIRALGAATSLELPPAPDGIIQPWRSVRLGGLTPSWNPPSLAA
jgi:predicted N-acetyltransferase YhbS